MYVLDDSNHKSYMFPILEGNVKKKGSNAVINCLLYFIHTAYKDNYLDNIFLLSDACGRQNRSHNPRFEIVRETEYM